MEFVLDDLLVDFNIKAVIFDLDGTLIDNNHYHLLAWKQYLKHEGINISNSEYNAHINGRTNKDAIEYIYKRKMDDEEAMVYALQKEAIYREIYLPHIQPVNGLKTLLDYLEQREFPMAIATSGIQVNIDFMFAHIPIKKYFARVVDSSGISKGKPDPEIYVKSAQYLLTPSENCLVFEDAVVGIQAAKAAGMKVIALTTTHNADELSVADMIISDYTELLSVRLQSE